MLRISSLCDDSSNRYGAIFFVTKRGENQMKYECFSVIGPEQLRRILIMNETRVGIIASIDRPTNTVTIRDCYSEGVYEVVGEGVYDILCEGTIIQV